MKPSSAYEFEFTGWAGENPYFLVINTDDPPGNWIIDLDEYAWMSQEPGLMRAPGEWVLIAKRDVNSHPLIPGMSQPIIAIRVAPGEQPYYTKRWVGIAYPAGGQLPLYGIGKKRLDGHVDRLWILPNGIIVPGDDGDVIATRMLKSLSQPQQEGAS